MILGRGDGFLACFVGHIFPDYTKPGLSALWNSRFLGTPIARAWCFAEAMADRSAQFRSEAGQRNSIRVRAQGCCFLRRIRTRSNGSLNGMTLFVGKATKFLRD
jgi:hypothetical protein